MQNNTFPKTEKLCSYSDIQKLFSEGKSNKNFPLKFLFIPLKKKLHKYSSVFLKEIFENLYSEIK